MADNDIEIRVVVDGEGAIRVFDKLGEEVDSLGSGVNDASGAFTRAQTNLLALNAAADLVGKGFSLLQSAVRGISTALTTLEGTAQLDAMRQGFKNLQDAAGYTADVSLQKLRTATRGLVSDVELMKAANLALTLGVDDGTDSFDQLAAAGTKIGRSLGLTATKAVESLTLGIGRQSTQVLDNLGVIVKAEAAYLKYAEAHGIVGRELTQEEKRMAFVTTAIEAINKKAATLEDTQLTAAEATVKLTTQMKNATDQFWLGVSSSGNLTEALGGVAKSVSDGRVEFKELGQTLGDLIAVAANLTAGFWEMIPSLEAARDQGANLAIVLKTIGGAISGDIFDQPIIAAATFSEKLEALNELLASGTPSAIDDSKAAWNSLRETIDESWILQMKYSDEMNTLWGKITEADNAARELAKGISITGDSSVTAEQRLVKLNKAIDDLKNGEGDSGSGGAIAAFAKDQQAWLNTIYDTNKRIDAELKRGIEQVTASYGNHSKLSDAASKDIRALAEEYLNAGGSAEVFDSTLDAVVEGLKEQERASADLIREQKAHAEATEKAKQEVDDYADSVVGVANEIDTSLIPTLTELSGNFDAQGVCIEENKGLLDELAQAYSDAGDSAEEFQDKAKKADGGDGGESTSFLDDLFGDMFGDKPILGILNGIRDIIEADRADREALLGEMGSELGAQAGSELGKATGIPGLDQVGEFVGDILGESIGKTIGHAFFGEHFETTARKDFEKAIKEMLGDFYLIIGNSNVNIGEVFAAGTDATESWKELAAVIQGSVEETEFMTSAYDGFWENIRTDTAQGIATFEGFLAAGGAFSVMFEELGLTAEQFGTILAKNVGGELNNLQIMLQGLGITQEQFAEALEQGYLNGTIQARDFVNGLEQTKDLFEKGIPGAIDAYDEAMKNLVKGGLLDGRHAMDAFQDIAVEAAEAGITNFEELRQKLIESGWEVETVEKFFSGLAAAGITDMTQLANVSVEQTGRIVTALEDVEFPFLDEADDKLDGIKQKLDAIEEEKYIDIYVRYHEQDKPEELGL